jgi:hypothetical protein
MKPTLTLCWMLLAGVVGAAEAWTPPESPDPQRILNEARSDVRERKFETALAKHVWFHEHALEYQPSLSGVRLSFALGSWMRLAEVYPPALVKLTEIRDETLRRVAPKKRGRISFEDFQALAAINRELDEESITVDAFRALDADDSDSAERVFLVAQPDLVEAKEYKLCGKYIETDESLRRIVDAYRMMRKHEQKPRVGSPLPEFATKKFINSAATLVALLVVNDRKAEAESLAPECKKEAGDAAFHAKLAAALDGALKGTVPKPWP